MSTLKTNNVQVGQSGTATNNFTLYQPSTPDGTVRLGVGNTGATTADVVTATSAGNVGIGTSSPVSSSQLTVAGKSLSVTGSDANFSAGGTRAMLDLNAGYVRFGGCAGGAATAVGIAFQYGPASGGCAEGARLDTSGNFQFNNGYGSVATAYGCRAWVNFNGTGTVAIRASGNVTSITDNGVGDYTVNFTTAMPDANYSVIATRQIGSNSLQARIFGQNANTAPATGSVRMYSYYYSSGADAAEDTAYAFVAIFR